MCCCCNGTNRRGCGWGCGNGVSATPAWDSAWNSNFGCTCHVACNCGCPYTLPAWNSFDTASATADSAWSAAALPAFLEPSGCGCG